MLKLSKRALALLALVVSVALVNTGCSGGGDDDDDGGGGAITVSVTVPPANQQPFLNTLGIVCANFTVDGPANQVFQLIAEYIEVGVGIPAPASMPLPEQTTAGGGPVPNLILTPLDGAGQFAGTAYWSAGRDLGFLPADVQFCLTATIGNDSGTGCSVTFTFPGGSPSQGSSGSGAGSGSQGNPSPMGTDPGRAGQTAHNVRGSLSPAAAKNILLAGGYNGSALPNAFQGVDRFDVSGGSSYQIAFPNSPVGQQRALHASSFFLDPATNIIKVLITGGVNAFSPPALNPTGLPNLANLVTGAMDTNSTSIYCFSPTEQLQAAPAMSTARWGHTATWCADGKVVVVGGASGTVTPNVLNSIEIYDPETNLWTTSAATLGSDAGCPPYTGRVFHTAVQLADGNVLIFGGFDPNNPMLELPAEIYDARNDTLTAICPPMATGFTRIGHTCTRLANGWILIAGGRDASGALLGTAMIYKPESGVPGALGFSSVAMPQAVAHHAATLQGNGQVLLSGGIYNAPGGSEGFTNAVVAYDPTQGDFGIFTSAVGSFMTDSRADHSSTAVDCGSVYIIGGRNGTSPTFTYLDSVEFYAFSNDVPVVTNPMTATSTGGPGTLALGFTVTDANQDGGYVYIRFREVGTNEWKKATIVSQMPSSAPSNFPNLEVFPGNFTLVWDAAADEVISGEAAEIQIIPVGAVLGTPVSFMVSIP